MSYERVEPVSVGTMINEKHINHHSICATLRRIYLRTESEDSKLELRLAMAMAKKMQKKLEEYKKASEN